MKTILLLALALTLPSCAERIQKAARDTAYSAYEWVGVEKRDLLRRRIKGAGEKQQDAGEAFSDALEKLQKLYGESGTVVEKEYRRLKSAYDEATEKSEEVSESREKMNTVAKDLFAEWEKEIGEMQSADFKNKSRASLRETKAKFTALHEALRKSENRMKPVLSKLKDHVLYLKHHVNAQAVDSLKLEGKRIEGEIEKLLADVKASTAEAEAFVKTME